MSYPDNKDKTFENRLSIACSEMGVQIDAGQRKQLLDYLDNLLRWNKTYNLTAIRNPEQGLVQHLFDSLSVVSPLTNFINKAGIQHPRILDVGSGGGLPGVVLAIVMKRADVTCVDAVEKKTSFIRQIASVLNLYNLKAIHSRIEVLEPVKADIVISRAFASLDDFATLSGRHVGSKGKLVGMKGKNPDDEKTALLQKGEWDIEKVERLNVPELQAERCLVWMQRKGKI